MLSKKTLSWNIYSKLNIYKMKTDKIAKYFNFAIFKHFFILRARYCSEINSAHEKWFKKTFLTWNRYEIQLSQDSNWQNREHFYFAILKHFHYSARLALSRNGISACKNGVKKRFCQKIGKKFNFRKIQTGKIANIFISRFLSIFIILHAWHCREMESAYAKMVKNVQNVFNTKCRQIHHFVKMGLDYTFIKLSSFSLFNNL